MAQADSGKHDATAFVLTHATSSHKFGGSAGGVLFWATGLVIGTLGDSLICVDVDAFERWSRAFDGQWVSWLGAILGYAMIANAAQRTSAEPRARAFAWLGILALLGWTYHLLVLRWPWLTGSVTEGMRLEVYAGALSQGWQGMPLVAFLELVATGLIVTQAALSLLQVARSRGLIPQADVPSRFRTGCISAALALFALQAFVIIRLAQGRY